MAASFKVPSLVKRSKLGTSFLKFHRRDITIQEELGRGTFSFVFFGQILERRVANVVIKKLKGESAEAKRRFEKKAGILNRVDPLIKPSWIRPRFKFLLHGTNSISENPI